jgi:hypothetical protein
VGLARLLKKAHLLRCASIASLAGRGNTHGKKSNLAQLRAVRPKLEKILKRSDDWEIVQVYKDYGYRLREIAAHLGVHYATVSRKRKKSRGDMILLDCKT